MTVPVLLEAGGLYAWQFLALLAKATTLCQSSDIINISSITGVMRESEEGLLMGPQRPASPI